MNLKRKVPEEGAPLTLELEATTLVLTATDDPTEETPVSTVPTNTNNKQRNNQSKIGQLKRSKR